MCGIFGVVTNKDNAVEMTFEGLRDIEYRGYDSWGIAFPNENRGFEIYKKIGFLPDEIPDQVRDDSVGSNLAIGHTRWATHGGVTDSNAHPHTGCNNKIAVVHNGIVENYLDLRNSLKNHKLKSETDTEVVAHLIEEGYQKTQDLLKSVVNVFNRLKGLNAFAVSDGKSIVACKIGTPLVVGRGENELFVASDPNAILPHTNNLLFLEDNRAVSLKDEIKLFNTENLKEISPEFTKVDWKHTVSNLDNFEHFMLKEIHEQPHVLQAIGNDGKEVDKVVEMIKDAHGTFFIGCGTASYACLAGVYLFSKYAKKHVNFSVGSEFSYNQDYLTDKSLLIAVSQSGESIDVVEPVSFAKKKQTKIVSLVNVLGSTLYRMSDFPLLLQAGVEKAVASTKAFTAMIAYMILLSHAVAGNKRAGQEKVIKSAEEVVKILENKEKIKELAEKIHSSEHIYILGRGASYPIALEATLKIKEVSYIHAEGFAGGELKHGVIALVEKGTPVIVFVPNDETKEAILANAMEVKARGAFVIGVGYEENEVFDYFFKVADTGASSIIPHTVFAQLLGYYLALKKGLNPDKPRNLAKSVVVR